MRIAMLMLAGLVAGCGDQREASEQQADATIVSHSSIKENFHLLEGDTEVLPPSLQLHLGKILNRGSQRRLKADLVQRARTDEGTAWVFLNGSEICLAQGGRGSVACSPVTRAKEGVSLGAFSPPSEQIPRPHDFLLLGLAPDGVTKVVVVIGARRRTLAVRNNLFAASGDRPVLTKRFVHESE